MEMYLSFWFGDYANTVEVMKNSNNILDKFPGAFGIDSLRSYVAMSYMFLARSEKQRGIRNGHMREAKKHMKVVKSVEEKGVSV